MNRCTGTVLLIHDTTEVDFSGLGSVDDLGPIGNGGRRGFLCHNSLAYDYQQREVLGLAAQSLQCRRRVPKGETARQKREHPQRESRLWRRNAAAVRELASTARIVHISDRGSDLFELLEFYEQGSESNGTAAASAYMRVSYVARSFSRKACRERVIKG